MPGVRHVRGAFALLGVLVLIAGCVTSVRIFALKTFTSVDGRFHMDVPEGQMTETSGAGTGPFARSSVHQFSHDADGMTFTVLYADADPSYLASTTIDAALSAIEQDNLATTKGTQTSDLETEVDDQPAREQRITGPSTSYRYHLVFVGDRFYSISAAGATAEVAGTEATTILGSFTVTP